MCNGFVALLRVWVMGLLDMDVVAVHDVGMHFSVISLFDNFFYLQLNTF